MARAGAPPTGGARLRRGVDRGFCNPQGPKIMLNTVAFLALAQLAGADAGDVKLADAGLAYGILGPTRAAAEYLPGDQVFVSFSIDGLTPDAIGHVAYQTAMELTDG